MPLYEYQCHRCEQVFEVLQKFSDAPLTIPEGCGGGVERLLSPPALQFKGSGWYVTDYARNGNSAGSNGSDKSASKDDTKLDAKSATKSESTPAPKPSGSEK